MNGLKMAAIYGLKPHDAGACGPKGKMTVVLLNYLRGLSKDENEIRKILSQFKRAYAYYQLIARSNGITDPFNPKVVEAYWLGNPLLDKVKIADLRNMLIKETPKFDEELNEKAIINMVAEIPSRALPHHSFQVIFQLGTTNESLDLCLVGWGKVKEINKKLIVEGWSIAHRDKLSIGNPIEKVIAWDESLLPNVKENDWISFHWNFACQILNKAQLANLEKYTKRTLAIF
jgi:hypothetical protein